MDIVAITALGRSVEDEAPALAAELGLTAYETGLMLRGAQPNVILRTDDRARALLVLERLRSRGHQAVAVDTAYVIASEQMFRPRRFVLEGLDFVARGEATEERLVTGSVFALVRAMHATRTEDTVTTKSREFSFGRAAMSGGVLMTKTKTKEEVRVTQEREPVLYAYREDGPPWLFRAQDLRYDGLGPRMLRSKAENFEVLIQVLREQSPQAHYDTRLLAIRAAPAKVTNAGASHLSTSSSGTVDLLAHIVATSLRRGAYR